MKIGRWIFILLLSAIWYYMIVMNIADYYLRNGNDIGLEVIDTQVKMINSQIDDDTLMVKKYKKQIDSLEIIQNYQYTKSNNIMKFIPSFLDPKNYIDEN